MGARAVLLDRDGTLVRPYHFPSRPEHLRLYDGVGAELVSLQRAGFKLVVITNQSGIARGKFDPDDLRRMNEHLGAELLRLGVVLDAVYYCPHHPDGVVRAYSMECDCRKPRPGMLLRAGGELGLDLERSWFVGDILDDVEAGNRAGCRTILVDLGTEAAPNGRLRTPSYVARDTPHALGIVRALEGVGPARGLGYLPAAWKRAPQPTGGVNR